MSDATLRLAAYGTLIPGEINHRQLDGLSGHWIAGTVRGHRVRAGKGTHRGLPGLILDAAGPEVSVQVFCSPDLPAHWPRLDAFEGPGYTRVTVEVATADGPLAASLYEIDPALVGE